MLHANASELAIEVLKFELAWLHVAGLVCAAIGATLVAATATTVVGLLIDSRRQSAPR